MEYVSRVPRAPLDGLIDDLYYLEGAPPYARLTLPPMPAARADPSSGTLVGHCHDRNRGFGLSPSLAALVRT
jgi:hypothetical protein